MNDTLISFETAKLAKEKGFNEYCTIGWVTKEIAGKYLDYNYKYNFSQDFILLKNIHFCPAYKPYFLNPTQSLLQKWLREKYKIHISIWFNKLTKKFRIDSIYSENSEYELEKEGEYNTYEESLEEGLKSALNLIK